MNGSILVAELSLYNMENILHLIQSTLFNYPLGAPILFICIHALMAVFFLPCSPMTLMAGALWGGVYGLIISMFAALVSLGSTFLLSRSFLHSRIENIFMYRYPRLAALLAQVSVHDWKIIALAQLNPLVPASTMGYAFGLTRVSLRRYLLFSTIFMLPLQAIFVMTGHSIISLLISREQWGMDLALIFLVAIITLFGKQIYRIICRLFGVRNGA